MYWSYFPHQPRNSVSPVCGIFFQLKLYCFQFSRNKANKYMFLITLVHHIKLYCKQYLKYHANGLKYTKNTLPQSNITKFWEEITAWVGGKIWCKIVIKLFAKKIKQLKILLWIYPKIYRIIGCTVIPFAPLSGNILFSKTRKSGLMSRLIINEFALSADSVSKLQYPSVVCVNVCVCHGVNRTWHIFIHLFLSFFLFFRFCPFWYWC